MADIDSKLEAGNRSPGIGYNDLLALSPKPAPASLFERDEASRGSAPLPVAPYISEDYAALERERMWPFVWQFAARDEDMPEDGDYVVYENAGRSYLLVRQEDGSVRAFHNVCLHRGRKLKTGDGWSGQIQCAFHGFTWNNDGSLGQIPCQWDFPHLSKSEMSLPEAEVGRWGGYIFVRDEPGGPSLDEFLAPIPEHFKRWRHEECTTVAWAAKEIDANWKVMVEAFMESWHTITTHPQILPFTGDSNAAYGVSGENVSVSFVPFGIMSPHLESSGRTEQWIVDSFVENIDFVEGGAASTISVPQGSTARRALGEAMREKYQAMSGHDLSDASDAEILDALVYNVFPNFAPWAGFMPNIVYRWRPGLTPDKSLMEIRILARVPAGQPIPRGVPMRMLGPDESWSACTEMGTLGAAIDQDQDNLPYVQEGLHASKTGEVNLANYQELRIRHFHERLDAYIMGNGVANGAGRQASEGLPKI